MSRLTVGGKEAHATDVAIYIKTNGVHTDLVVPIKDKQIDWAKEIKFANAHLADTSPIKWLAIG